jgi:hypothetical protein
MANCWSKGLLSISEWFPVQDLNLWHYKHDVYYALTESVLEVKRVMWSNDKTAHIAPGVTLKAVDYVTRKQEKLWILNCDI